MNIEASYLAMDVKTEITNGGSTNTEDLENNSWLIGGALKYAFWRRSISSNW